MASHTYDTVITLVRLLLIFASLGMLFRFKSGWKDKAGRIALVPMFCAILISVGHMDTSSQLLQYSNLIVAFVAAGMVVWLCWNTAKTAEHLGATS